MQNNNNLFTINYEQIPNLFTLTINTSPITGENYTIKTSNYNTILTELKYYFSEININNGEYLPIKLS